MDGNGIPIRLRWNRNEIKSNYFSEISLLRVKSTTDRWFGESAKAKEWTTESETICNCNCIIPTWNRSSPTFTLPLFLFLSLLSTRPWISNKYWITVTIELPLPWIDCVIDINCNRSSCRSVVRWRKWFCALFAISTAEEFTIKSSNNIRNWIIAVIINLQIGASLLLFNATPSFYTIIVIDCR